MIDPATTIEVSSTLHGLQQPKMVWKIGTDNYLHHTKDRSGELKILLLPKLSQNKD